MRAQDIDRDPKLRISAGRKGERARENTDNRVGLFVQIHHLPQHIAPRAEAMKPRAVTQNHNIGPAYLSLAGIEIATQQGMHTEGHKKAAAYTLALNRLGG